MSALDPRCPATAHVIDQTLMSTGRVESTTFHRRSSLQVIARDDDHVTVTLFSIVFIRSV